MIKFTASGKGVTTIGLGLVEGNVERMRAGQPVYVRLSEMGFVGAMGATTICIFLGKTEQELAETLKEFIGPETAILTEVQP